MDNFKFDVTKKYTIEELLDVIGSKAHDLVWLARKPHAGDPDAMAEFYDNGCNLGTRVHMNQIAEAYPEEVEALGCPMQGDWAHGFNSGMLATVRLLSTALQLDVTEEQLKEMADEDDTPYNPLEQALLDFPFLDT